MEALTLKLSPRSVVGKKAKVLRRAGIVPVHLFGRDTESLALQAEASELRRLILRAGGNVPVVVEVQGQDRENVCFVREVQRHPVTEGLLHVDFLRVDVSRKVLAEVPVVLEGEAPAVPELGGILLQVMNSLEVESLPMSMPAAFHLDVSGLDDFEKSLRISDVRLDADVTILRGPQEMIARVVRPRVEEEAVEEEEEEILAEGEVPEGEEPQEEGSA